MAYFTHRVWVEDLTSEHYRKWSSCSFFACVFAHLTICKKLIGQSNLYLPQCALDGDCHTEIKMRFCKWIFLLSLYFIFLFFVLSSCVFNPRGQLFPQAPISILAHSGQPRLNPRLRFSYCILHDRLQQAFKCNVHLNCCLWKQSPVMIYFFPPLPSTTNTAGVFMNLASTLISILERSDFHLR